MCVCEGDRETGDRREDGGHARFSGSIMQVQGCEAPELREAQWMTSLKTRWRAKLRYCTSICALKVCVSACTDM